MFRISFNSWPNKQLMYEMVVYRSHLEGEVGCKNRKSLRSASSHVLTLLLKLFDYFCIITYPSSVFQGLLAHLFGQNMCCKLDTSVQD